MSEGTLKFCATIEKAMEGAWSIGVCFSHQFDETYLFINLVKWTISIGKIRIYD